MRSIRQLNKLVIAIFKLKENLMPNITPLSVIKNNKLKCHNVYE